MSGKSKKVGRVTPCALPIANRRVRRATDCPPFRVKPDFVFRKARLAVFVDGCFWHGCPRHATQPKNNRSFWRKKLAGNKARDRRVNRALRSANWRLLRIWECDLQRATKDLSAATRLVQRIEKALN